MNLSQEYTRIESVAKEVARRVVADSTRDLPNGVYVVEVYRGQATYRPFRDVLAQELATVLDLLAATRPDVAEAVKEWEVGNG